MIKGKLLESKTLIQQAANNTKEQFANSPDFDREELNAIMEALDAHSLMSSRMLNSPPARRALRDYLLNHAGLYEALRAKASATTAVGVQEPRIALSL